MLDTKSFLLGAGIGVVALIGNAIANYKLGLDHGHYMFALGLVEGHKSGMKVERERIELEQEK